MRRLAVTLLAAAACLTGCATSRGSMAAAVQPHGQWVLKKVVNNGREINVPTSLDVYLIFGKNNEVRGFDGCSTYDATLHRSSDGSMKVVEAAVSGNGCLSLGVAPDAARDAIDILFYRSRPITISERGHRLTIATRGHSLTYIPRSAVRAAANAFRRISSAKGEPSPHDAAYVISPSHRIGIVLVSGHSPRS